MTKITYIPGEIANAAIDEHGNRKPVTRTQHIFDDNLEKPQNEVNQDRIEDVATLDGKIALEKQRAEGVESGLNNRLGTVEQLAEISIGGGDAQIATGADFTNPDATKRAKVTTVGAIIDGLNDGVYDVSKRNPSGGPNSDGKFTLEYILSNANTLIPTSWRHGGMTISFVQCSDNKYVQYMLTAQTWSNTISDWECVEDIAGNVVDTLDKGTFIGGNTANVSPSGSAMLLTLSNLNIVSGDLVCFHVESDVLTFTPKYRYRFNDVETWTTVYSLDDLIFKTEFAITNIQISVGTGWATSSGTAYAEVRVNGKIAKIESELSNTTQTANNAYDNTINLDNNIYGQILDSTYEIAPGITPASTNILTSTDISGYNLKSGDKIKIHVGFGGAIKNYRLYINNTNKGTIKAEDYVYTFEENGEVIRLNTAEANIVVDETTGKTVGGTVTIHIEFRQGSIPYLQEEINDIKDDNSNTILSRNSDVKDKVYAGKFINIPSTKEQVSLFQLLISGDIHGYSDQMNNIIEYFNGISNIDAGIMLGDLVGSNYTSSFDFYVPALEKIADNKPFITIAGNHDMGTSTDPTVDAPSMQAYYNRYYAPTLPFANLASGEHSGENCYFFKDFSTYKLRMIMLNEYDYPDADLTDLVDGQLRYQRGVSMYSQEQIDWLIATLNSTPSDYAVIIALHMCPWRMYGEQSPFTAIQYEGNFGRSSSAMSGDVIGDIVNAWKNGTTLSETYNIEVTSSRTSVTASADFSNRGTGEFVCYLGGHWHNYIISHDQKYNDQLMITVNNAGCIARESDMPRLVGGKSEDAFALISVDRVNKYVNLITVGARMNCRMVLRETLRIAYDN